MSAGISELSSRSGDGVDVTLPWQRCDNTAFVAVDDRRTGEEFFLDINEDDNALDMFHHPFAYAAHRRIEKGWDTHPQGFRVAA
jgi:hypothetical protein